MGAGAKTEYGCTLVPRILGFTAKSLRRNKPIWTKPSPGAPSVTETAVLENKRLGGLLALIRQDQQTQPPGMRTSKGSKRRDQTKHMFSVG